MRLMAIEVMKVDSATTYEIYIYILYILHEKESDTSYMRESGNLEVWHFFFSWLDAPQECRKNVVRSVC